MFKGHRKLLMCAGYLGCTTGLCQSAISSMTEFGMDQFSGLAALTMGMATGLGVVVYGNVKEHQANGSS